MIFFHRNTRRKTNNPVLILAQNNNKKYCAPSLLHQDQTIFDPPRRFSDDYQPDISGMVIFFYCYITNKLALPSR